MRVLFGELDDLLVIVISIIFVVRGDHCEDGPLVGGGGGVVGGTTRI